MTLFHIVVLAAFLPLAAVAQQTAAPEPGAAVVTAADTTLAEHLWTRRPVVVFADTPNDPAFQRQMQRIEAGMDELIRRDVIVITDTDPDARTAIRQKLRPRGFSLVIMDKDGEVKRRNPAPWDVREIASTIDRFPLRRQELLERSPAGR
jgi:hypothetical protein